MLSVQFSMMSATPTTVHPERCLWQRHQGAACQYCLTACPSGAIQLNQRWIELNIDRCLGCGLCLAVCPVECFETDEWSERSIASTLTRLKQPAVEVTCKCHPAPLEGSEATPVVQVNACLGAISPGLWFEIGFEYMVKVRLEYCTNCPISRSARYVLGAIDLATKWLESCGHTPGLLIEESPLVSLEVKKRVVVSAERPILNRRDFLFSFVRSSGPPAQALRCLPCEWEDDPTGKTAPHQPAWLRQLAAIYPTAVRSPTEAAPSKLAINDLRDCALWPTLSIAENCVACGACARYCPSGALSTVVTAGRFQHVFIPGTCIACGLCAQVCQEKALTRDYAEELEPFVEQVIAERLIKSCRKCGSPAVEAYQGLCYWCAAETPMRSLLDNARDHLLKK